jgi:entericidin B
MKKLIAIFGVVMFASSLAACNTFAGAGKDIERGGEKVQDAATNKK